MSTILEATEQLPIRYGTAPENLGNVTKTMLETNERLPVLQEAAPENLGNVTETILEASERLPVLQGAAPENQGNGTETPHLLKSDPLALYLADKADQLANMGWLRRHGRDWYMRAGGIYLPLSEMAFCNHVFNLAYSEGFLLKASHCRRLLTETMVRTPDSLNPPNDESYTVFTNGIFSNIDGRTLLTPPDYFATICVNGNYLQGAPLSHPVADAFFAKISGGDPELTARHWEVLGYLLSSDARAKSIFMLYGASGNNGKSTLLALIANLLSPGSVDSMPLTTMLSRFGLQRIFGRRVQYSGDEGNMNLNSNQIALLKAISGHDGMTADVKNQEMKQFICTCKVVIASNHNIGMAYASVDPAFARRLVTLPFLVSIPREEQDPYILDRLLSERDAIVTHAYNSYLQLRERNYKFTGSERFDAVSPVIFAPVNPQYNAVRTFSESNCEFTDASAFTATDDLYRQFCMQYGGLFKDKTGFSQAFNLVNAGKVQSYRYHTSATNLRGFFGVTLRQPVPDSPEVTNNRKETC